MANQERAQHVYGVLKKLDPNNAEHWTSQGVPRMDALEALGLKITRAELTELAPGFRRPEGDEPEGESEGAEAQEREGDPEHPGFSDPEFAHEEDPRNPRPERVAKVNEYACKSFIKLNAARAQQGQREAAALREVRGDTRVRGTPLSPLDQRIAREARRARKMAARGQL